jgi:hypothetical protein
MASRTTLSELSSPPVTGAALLEEYADRLKTLFDASALPLTSIGGTGNAVTATLDPALDGGGLVDGMKFEITWGAANTAGVTLALNGGSALAVLDPAGTALVAGAIGSGLRSLLEYIGGAFRILSPLLTSLGGGSARYYWQFTASGTWNKPAGLDDDTMVFVEAWAGGGGGASASPGGGGGGGGWIGAWFRLGDMPSSVSVTIGPGGAVNSNGSNTTFGSLLTAWAGIGATGATGARGGGAAAGGLFGSGFGGPNSGDKSGGPALTENGGGGGGGSAASSAGGNGGAALRGGGGGGGINSGAFAPGTGGVSVFGGNGGDSGVAGSAPGGGGGRNAAGARGEIRVWI